MIASQAEILDRKKWSRGLQFILILFAAFQLSLAIRQHVEFKSHLFLIDSDVYAHAIQRYLAGGNPYDLTIKPRFVYHPFFLQVFSLAGNHAKDFLLFLYTLSGVYIFSALSKRREMLYPFFLAFCFCGIGFDQLMGGHLTLPLHFLLLAPLVSGISTEQQCNRYIGIVALTSIIKPYMIAYLLIPIFASFQRSHNWVNILKKTMYAVLGLTLLVSIDYGYAPDLTNQFLDTLHQQTLGDGDLGQGFFYLFFKWTHSTVKALALHSLAIMLLCGPILFLFWKRMDQNQEAFIFYLYFFLTMINPRIKEYDLCAALIAIFISWWMLNQQKWGDAILSLAFLVSVFRLILLFKQHENPMLAISGFAFYITVIILTIGYWVLLPRQEEHSSTEAL
jgi:hypothetical protein